MVNEEGFSIMPLCDEMRRPVPQTPSIIPNIFFIDICSFDKRKWARSKMIKGIVAMHNPTKTEDKCSWATASNMKGKVLDNKATPKHASQ